MKYLSKHSHSGYSLLELIVVLVVIGLFSAIVTPFLITNLSNTRIKTSAKEIAATFRYARSQAITSKRTHYFYLDTSNAEYWVSSEKAKKNKRGEFDYKNILKTAKRTRSLSNDIMIQQIEVGTSTETEKVKIIPFFPQGNTIGAKIILQKRNSTRSYTIVLDKVSGKVKIVNG